MDKPVNINPILNPDMSATPSDLSVKKVFNSPMSVQTLKQFMQLAGGSWLYCLSAVFITFGIVKVLGPVLEGSDKMTKALPCILTLHGYELALLLALIIIVLRKVVDDAVSLVIIMALFLVGTAIAAGSAVNKDISTGMTIGCIGIALAVFKLFMMRRFAGIPFGLYSILGLSGIMACNYLGPVLMARNILTAPSDEPARKTLWMLFYIGILVMAGFICYESFRIKTETDKGRPKAPFLQRPVMVCLFSILLLAASGANLYTMEYSSGLQFALADFIPLGAVVCILLMELTRQTGKRFGILEMIIASLPLAAAMLAIDAKDILASGQLTPHIICYPPIMLALCGLFVAVTAFYHRRKLLWWIVAAYALGIILTAGFSLEKPYDLNYKTCGIILSAGLFAYGLYVRKSWISLAGLFILCAGAFHSHIFTKTMVDWQLTPLGGSAGLWGLGCIFLTIIFAEKFHLFLRTTGVFGIALFFYDFMPTSFHWQYLVVLIAAAVIAYAMWYKTKELASAFIFCIPLIIRSYMATKQFANWRFIGLGFVLLIFGTLASLMKRPIQKQELNKLD